MSHKSPLTPAESHQLEWCLSILAEENVVECQDEAETIAHQQFHASKAYDDLLPLLVKIKLDELQRLESDTERLPPSQPNR